MDKKDSYVNDIDTQTKKIAAYLKSGKSITQLEALQYFGCFRLGARIYDLKRRGYQIKTDIIHDSGKRFARYSLESLNG